MHTPPASTTTEWTPPVEVRTTPAKTMKVCAMPTCTTCRDGVIGPHAHGSMGRQVVDDRDNMWRGGAIGPHAHGNTARHVADDTNVEGVGSKNRKTTRATTSTTAVCQLLGCATTERTPQGTQARALSRNSNPTDHIPTETQRGRWWTTRMQRGLGCKDQKATPQQPEKPHRAN